MEKQLYGEVYKDYHLEFTKKDNVVWTEIFKKEDHSKILSSYISDTKEEGLNKGKDWIDRIESSNLEPERHYSKDLNCYQCKKQIITDFSLRAGKGVGAGEVITHFCSPECRTQFNKKNVLGMTEGQFYSHWKGNSRCD